MLKIKDDVDLKELEKFGLKLYLVVYRKDDNGNKIYQYRKNGAASNVGIEEITRKIVVNENRLYPSLTNIDVIYDLIQAGLVEKVSDEE